MSTLTFDTYEFVKQLRDAGFNELQAETITRLQKATSANTLEQAKHDYELDNIATKRDIRELELKLELKIAETKAELIRWVVGVGLLQTTIIAALILKLVGH